MTEDDMVGWHHRFNGHEFEQAPGVGDGQGNLACCSLWGHKKLDMTERLKLTEMIDFVSIISIRCVLFLSQLNNSCLFYSHLYRVTRSL